MKIIFLDVDGVLNSAEDYYTTKLTNPSSQHRLNLLYSSIINSGNTADDAQICISSSWRVPPRLKNHLIDQLNKHNMKVCGCTEYDNKTRGQQISDYLNNNADKNITGYVVIDDETNDMENLPAERIVKTDENVGLTETDAQRVAYILNI